MDGGAAPGASMAVSVAFAHSFPPDRLQLGLRVQNGMPGGPIASLKKLTTPSIFCIIHQLPLERCCLKSGPRLDVIDEWPVI